MKNLKTLLIVIGAVAIFASCSKPNQHLNTIPISADMVGAIDLFNIAQKAELYNMDQYTFYAEAMQKMEKENPEMQLMIKELIANPLSTGLRYREGLYFCVENIKENPFLITTMSIRNAGDFDEFVKKIAKTSKTKVEVKEKDGINYLFTKHNMMILFDNTKMLNVTKNDGTEDELFEYGKSLMLQNAESSIVSHSDFASFLKNKKDINLWIATGKISQTPQTAIITGQLPFKIDNNFAHVYMEFKDDGIFGTTKMSVNDEIKKIVNDYEFMKPGFDEKLLTYFPQENYITYGFAINPGSIYKFFNDIPSYKQLINQANSSSPLEIEQFINSIGGDIIVAVHGFQIPEEATTTEPSQGTDLKVFATAVMSMNNDKTYNQLKQFIPQEMFNEENGIYSGNIQGIDVFFGLFDNNLIVTTDSKVIDGAKAGGLEKNLADTELKKLFTKTSFMYMNMDIEQFPNDLKAAVEKNMNSDELAAFKAVTNKTKEMKIYGSNLNEGKFEFYMKNTDGNSLHTILQLIDEIYQAQKKSHEMADMP